MTTDSAGLSEFFTSLHHNATFLSAWQQAGAIVAFQVPDAGYQVTLGADGEPAASRPTHVFTIDSEPLRLLVEGERSFLRTLTARQVHIVGPVIQSLAVGQALAGAARN